MFYTKDEEIIVYTWLIFIKGLILNKRFGSYCLHLASSCLNKCFNALFVRDKHNITDTRNNLEGGKMAVSCTEYRNQIKRFLQQALRET